MLTVGITMTNFPLHAENLKDYLWKNRVIITFSSTKSDPDRLLLKKQIDEFHCEFKNRDLVHFDLIQGSDDYESLSKKFYISTPKFKLVLLGKDGEVKLKTDSTSLADVFSKIDSMPMRQREIHDEKC